MPAALPVLRRSPEQPAPRKQRYHSTVVVGVGRAVTATVITPVTSPCTAAPLLKHSAKHSRARHSSSACRKPRRSPPQAHYRYAVWRTETVVVCRRGGTPPHRYAHTHTRVKPPHCNHRNALPHTARSPTVGDTLSSAAYGSRPALGPRTRLVPLPPTPPLNPFSSASSSSSASPPLCFIPLPFSPFLFLFLPLLFHTSPFIYVMHHHLCLNFSSFLHHRPKSPLLIHIRPNLIHSHNHPTHSTSHYSKAGDQSKCGGRGRGVERGEWRRRQRGREGERIGRGREKERGEG